MELDSVGNLASAWHGLEPEDLYESIEGKSEAYLLSLTVYILSAPEILTSSASLGKYTYSNVVNVYFSVPYRRALVFFLAGNL